MKLSITVFSLLAIASSVLALPVENTTSSVDVTEGDDTVGTLERHCRCDILCRCPAPRFDPDCYRDCASCLFAESLRPGSSCWDN
ncbi:hypothetical protein BDY21DRAFT_368720 [Lineolata rhizophorae]|uniref:Uncharacterized protein n=1 Tax=Lineolata rhizophorae TaxID=578093 RepID=A0A6A6PC43_9PEZI|nr:hypothetical protein BDY21DRAFT_368720 [Lineolata rhizophorae]